MFSHLIELIILAGIAFFLINKLISILGSVDEDGLKHRNNQSFFGEPTSLKDVTNTADINNKQTILPEILELQKYDMILSSNVQKINSEILSLKQKLPYFNLIKFIEITKTVVPMIIYASQKNDNKTLSVLLDKRFIEQFSQISHRYADFNTKKLNLMIKIFDVYSFSHSVFIKVYLLMSDQLHSNQYQEEWIFTKTTTSINTEWYLSNINQAFLN